MTKRGCNDGLGNSFDGRASGSWLVLLIGYGVTDRMLLGGFRMLIAWCSGADESR